MADRPDLAHVADRLLRLRQHRDGLKRDPQALPLMVHGTEQQIRETSEALQAAADQAGEPLDIPLTSGVGILVCPRGWTMERLSAWRRARRRA